MHYKVVIGKRATADLRRLLLYIAKASSAATAAAYIARIETFFLKLNLFPERGTRLPNGTRIIAFEDSATIRIRVTRSTVRVLKVTYRGRDPYKEFS